MVAVEKSRKRSGFITPDYHNSEPRRGGGILVYILPIMDHTERPREGYYFQASGI